MLRVDLEKFRSARASNALICRLIAKRLVREPGCFEMVSADTFTSLEMLIFSAEIGDSNAGLRLNLITAIVVSHK
jgi:hypothetical protein